MARVTHVDGWKPTVYMSYMGDNFRLFRVPNLAVLNFLFFSALVSGLADESQPVSSWQSARTGRHLAVPSVCRLCGGWRGDIPTPGQGEGWMVHDGHFSLSRLLLSCPWRMLFWWYSTRASSYSSTDAVMKKLFCRLTVFVDGELLTQLGLEISSMVFLFDSEEHSADKFNAYQPCRRVKVAGKSFKKQFVPFPCWSVWNVFHSVSVIYKSCAVPLAAIRYQYVKHHERWLWSYGWINISCLDTAE